MGILLVYDVTDEASFNSKVSSPIFVDQIAWHVFPSLCSFSLVHTHPSCFFHAMQP